MRTKMILMLALALFASTTLVACQTAESTTMDDAAAEMVVGEEAGADQAEQAEAEGAEAAEAAPANANADEASDEDTSDEAGTMAGARTFMIMPEQSMASYEADEVFFQGAVERLGVALGDFRAIGTTGDVGGALTVNFDGSPTVEGGEIIVNLTSLTSDNDRRDDKMREEWLESMLYPEAVFTVTGSEGLPESYTDGDPVTFTLLGDLNVRGISVPVAWTVVATLAGDTLTGQAETTVSIPDFGFDAPDMAGFLKVAEEITLKADLTAMAQ